MARVAVEAFTDPYSPWCWASQPSRRRLRYAFEDVEWTPRMTVLLPSTAESDEEEARRTAWAEVAGATGMPVADPLWPEGLPDSRPACAAVAFLRESAPDRALAGLRRLREAAFAEGRAVEAPDDVAAVVGEVDGVSRATVHGALEDGRAADALEADLVRAVEVAEARSAAEVRGELSLLPAGERMTDMRPDGGGTETPDEDGGEDQAEATEPVLVGPPTLRVERDSTVILCDARLPYGRLATAFGRSTPDAGVTVDDQFAISRMAMHVPREVAESLSAQDFAAEVAPYLTRFGRAYLPEIVAATGRSATTCVEALERLVERGDAVRLGPREWRTVEEAGPQRRQP